LDRAAVGPAAPLLNPAAKLVGDFASQQRQVGKILSVFVPFSAEYDYVFRCDHVRSAYARLSEQDKQRIGWTPENIDWRHWFLDVHIPALEKWVFPKIEERVNRPRKPPQRHETLPALLDEMAERYDLAIALQRTQKDGLSWLSFRDWRERAGACAVRLRELGVRPGERVLLAGKNHPAWPVAFFGIVWSGATAVPVEAGIEPDTAENLLRASGARVVVLDRPARERLCVKLNGPTIFLDLLEVCEPGPTMDSRVESSEDIAALIYTSGTTGVPKGVMLSHANLTSLVAALVPLFPLGKEDRILSVLPLHHTFELTCGMLLPLSRGSRIVYLDELKASELESALKSGRITGLIGVPALWEMLERSIHARVAERGKLAAHLFEFAVELNRTLGKKLGVDAGRLLFGPVHEALGGHLRFLVSGGAALNPRTHELFAGLGLHLSQGYGLTEAAPVLTVAAGGPRAKSEQVGKPIPGVELRIESPNRDGVGEVVARGPNVMVGYSNQEVGGQARDSEGWLHTGDLGRIDRQGHLVIVGRSKDTIVTSNGENVYPEDVEARLGRLQYISELAVVGLADTRSGERVACAAVAEENPDLTRSERHALARRSLETAISKLPTHMQPVVTVILDAPLPRTQTRKVKRAEVRKLVEHVGVTAKDQPLPAGEALGATELVRSAAAAVCRRDPGELHSGLSLRGDLAFDSLMLLEFLVAVEARAGANLDAERFAQAQTLADVEDLVRDSKVGRRLVQSSTIEKDADRSLMLPPILREAAMRWLGQAQMSFYDHVLSTKVTGRAFIPHNRHAIVAANHASHLDMGLVKYALGAYGQGLVSLAAQDYFFEGKRWRKAYFENLTNLVPLPRNGSLRQALRQVGELLEKGKTVLIFPEGTRTVDGDIHEFKPAIGHLALHQGVDVLPVWLGGTFQALPKGATVLRQRNVDARIGPPLEVSHLKRLTYGMLPTEASRTVAQLVRRAVLALSRGELLDIKQLTPNDLEPTENAPSLEPVFRELANRFVAGCVEQPVSYYFSLGTKERWSVRITPDSCEVAPGKAVNPADCVLKTSPAMFTRIVREAYTPSPAEFVSGTVKSNNIALLLTFQRAFQLQG
jgi:long-chain acyl-CoA synthetase